MFHWHIKGGTLNGIEYQQQQQGGLSPRMVMTAPGSASAVLPGKYASTESLHTPPTAPSAVQQQQPQVHEERPEEAHEEQQNNSSPQVRFYSLKS